MQGVIRFAVFVLVSLIFSCSFSSNGERIFFTATSKNGPITIKEGPPMIKNGSKGLRSLPWQGGQRRPQP